MASEDEALRAELEAALHHESSDGYSTPAPRSQTEKTHETPKAMVCYFKCYNFKGVQISHFSHENQAYLLLFMNI